MGAGERRTSLSHREKCCVLRRTCSSVCVATVGFVSILGVSLLWLPEPRIVDPLVSKVNSPVTILIWTQPFGHYSSLPDCSELYQIDQCTLTDDARAYLHADAVIVHHREVATGKADLPPEPRPRAQKWIWMNFESPTHTHRLRYFEGVFNLTMTYRTDSDIFVPYGYLFRNKGVQNHFVHPLRVPTRSRLHRPRLVVWVVSNWSESHARVAFYYSLSRYIRVDVFGRAGRPVPKDSTVVRLVERYQFYLALENSQHTDYITEKLWNAVQAGAIPVVLGPSRQNYERFLPPEAFIHVDDFPTVRGLARYLMMLRRNPARLRRHLNWRGSYSMHQASFWAEHYCTACNAVMRNRGRTDVVQHLTGWFES
ncbi:Alpha-(1,3)-fucosyltransferase 4 [Larimichthys crocea]|uniref:Fucosyltransferase n=1 Tax=Larimichthys crocea TaxID=215358 RepID=A0A6G0IV84_LARCR|nr:alpha-(1,3)-fucosyltransferase 4-like [Larimichthys crocea]KAE8295244.1 Alpha-(1,3)-fucosyltransferase 4 [Larimichthys crocea]